MIVYKNCQFIGNSDYPNSDWIGDADFVVSDGSAIAQKLIAFFPNCELIIENGDLIDVAETVPPPREYEPTREEIDMDFDFRLSCLELGL